MSEDQLKPLQAALEDHSAEGIAILTAEPSRLIQATLLVIAGLLVSALAWAFVGRADVIVSVSGALEPEGEVRRVYAPVEGELVDLFVAEGTPVTAGDVIARLNARRAVEVAANALDAQIALSEAEFRVEQFPQAKVLKLEEAASLQRQIEIERAAHERRLAEGMSRLTEANKARLEEARTNLDEANRKRDLALDEYQKYQRLYNSAGGGGVARKEVEDRRAAYETSESEARVAEAKLSELELELSRAYASAKTELETSDQKLNALKLKRATLLKDLEQEEKRIQAELQSARLRAQSTQRVSFDNIDDDNFLRVLAPVSGIVTDLAVTQPGQQVGANTPLGSIAPSNARPLLVVEVPERDRGFLREGQPARLKFNAFPYQRYGEIAGVVEYLAPAARLSPQAKEPVYEARISLERDQFDVGDQVYPLRYGMIATAEIVVRERRLIDLALDPLRNI